MLSLVADGWFCHCARIPARQHRALWQLKLSAAGAICASCWRHSIVLKRLPRLFVNARFSVATVEVAIKRLAPVSCAALTVKLLFCAVWLTMGKFSRAAH